MDAAGNATSQGYSYWYLPNDIELTLMWNTIGQGSDNAGGFEDYFYWLTNKDSASSTEGDSSVPDLEISS